MSRPPLRIALPSKGRLAENALRLFRDAGIPVAADDRRLLLPIAEQDMEVLFVRADDIPTLVGDRAADIGVAGHNQLLEHGDQGLEVLLDLGFGRCRLVIAAPRDGGIDRPQDLEGRRVATSHPTCLRRFLEQEGIGASIVPLSGSIELAPTIGAADAVADLVSTGETLRQNGLREVGTVLDSQAVLISYAGHAEDDGRIEVLRTALQSVLAARPKRYLMLNAPDASLDAIIGLLPGIDAPTVLPLARQGMHAVHAVVDADDLPRLLHPLQTEGASGILVLPIEHLIP
jgi:ATP phosphoribosyltransferase